MYPVLAGRIPRSNVRTLRGALVCLVLLIAALGVAQPRPVRAASGIYVGVSITNVPYTLAPLSQFESDLGKHAAIVNFWRDFGSANNTIPAFYLQNLDAHGSVPMVTWLPTNWDGGDQSPYSLAAIAGGAQDGYLRGWAQQLAAYGKPILLRFAQEMNGNWFPQWSGNPSQYIAAWRHLHDVFAQAGATNVQWVWAPNSWYQVSLATDGRAYYPGDGYVDWVALDGYNSPPGGWQSFSTLFGYAYDQLSAMTSKPIMIAETSSGEATAQQAAQGLSKAGWIQSAFASELPQRFPRLGAVVWMNDDLTPSEGCCDWRIESSAQAQAAAHQAIGQNSLYLGSYGAGSAALGAPGLTSPPEGATGVSRTPTLQWSAASGAGASTQYTGFIWDPTANAMAWQGSTTGLSVSVPAGSPLLAGHFYYYSAQACTGSACGPLARWEGFTTIGTPGAPGLTSPAEGASGVSRTPTLQWTAPTGAVAGTTQYTGYVWDPAANAMAWQGTTTQLSVTVPAGSTLAAGHFYYYSVQACNGAACGANARWEGFTTQSSLGTPGLLAPVEGSTANGVTPTLRWSAASGATASTQYTAYVWDPASSTMKFQQTVSGLSVAVPQSAGLVAGHFYYYSVQACTGSDCGPLARWEGFTS